MPQRYIRIPEPVRLKSRGGEESDHEVDMGEIIDKLLSDPRWVETRARMRAADAIWAAWESRDDGVMGLSEEDWKELDACAENPKFTMVSPEGKVTTMHGLGYLPRVTPQLLCFLDAIGDASRKHPREAKKDSKD